MACSYSFFSRGAALLRIIATYVPLFPLESQFLVPEINMDDSPVCGSSFDLATLRCP